MQRPVRAILLVVFSSLAESTPFGGENLAFKINENENFFHSGVAANASTGIRSPLSSLTVNYAGKKVATSTFTITGICAAAAQGVETAVRESIAMTLVVNTSDVLISEYTDMTPALCANKSSLVMLQPTNMSANEEHGGDGNETMTRVGYRVDIPSTTEAYLRVVAMNKALEYHIAQTEKKCHDLNGQAMACNNGNLKENLLMQLTLSGFTPGHAIEIFHEHASAATIIELTPSPTPALMQAGQTSNADGITFAPGERVEISDGTLKGQVATILQGEFANGDIEISVHPDTSTTYPASMLTRIAPKFHNGAEVMVVSGPLKGEKAVVQDNRVDLNSAIVLKHGETDGRYTEAWVELALDGTNGPTSGQAKKPPSGGSAGGTASRDQQRVVSILLYTTVCLALLVLVMFVVLWRRRYTDHKLPIMTPNPTSPASAASFDTRSEDTEDTRTAAKVSTRSVAICREPQPPPGSQSRGMVSGEIQGLSMTNKVDRGSAGGVPPAYSKPQSPVRHHGSSASQYQMPSPHKTRIIQSTSPRKTPPRSFHGAVVHTSKNPKSPRRTAQMRSQTQTREGGLEPFVSISGCLSSPDR
jgi:hypothetical protein